VQRPSSSLEGACKGVGGKREAGVGEDGAKEEKNAADGLVRTDRKHWGPAGAAGDGKESGDQDGRQEAGAEAQGRMGGRVVSAGEEGFRKSKREPDSERGRDGEGETSLAGGRGPQAGKPEAEAEAEAEPDGEVEPESVRGLAMSVARDPAIDAKMEPSVLPAPVPSRQTMFAELRKRCARLSVSVGGGGRRSDRKRQRRGGSTAVQPLCHNIFPMRYPPCPRFTAISCQWLYRCCCRR
jgi:hypothetical protein